MKRSKLIEKIRNAGIDAKKTKGGILVGKDTLLKYEESITIKSAGVEIGRTIFKPLFMGHTSIYIEDITLSYPKKLLAKKLTKLGIECSVIKKGVLLNSGEIINRDAVVELYVSSKEAQIQRADYGDGSVRYFVTDRHPKCNMFEEKDTTQMPLKRIFTIKEWAEKYRNPLKSVEPLSNSIISDTLEEREQTHGDYTTFAEIWRELENIVFSEWDGSDVESSSMSMILHKIARVLNAPKPHIDNWIDIEEYARLVVDNTEDELFDYTLNGTIHQELVETIKAKGSHLGDLEYRGLMRIVTRLSMMLATSSWNDINRISENIVKELQYESNSSPKK